MAATGDLDDTQPDDSVHARAVAAARNVPRHRKCVRHRTPRGCARRGPLPGAAAPAAAAGSS